MNKLLALGFAALFASPLLSACIAATGDSSDPAGSDEELGDDDAVATSENALGPCYCAKPYACGHSTSPTFVYPAADKALAASGVSHGEYLQTYGDASASVGTHCPESGTHYSAATDVTASAHPCARVHALRMHGFAAWYRYPPSFTPHIHAIYAGTPVLKQSLKNQLASFFQGRNGLVSNAVDTVCPITAAEKAAVHAVHDGGGGGSCVPGGRYCGGDKISGNASTLYQCDANGTTATKIRYCSHGCSVNVGEDDSCRCSAGGYYCGGDVVDGSSSSLYRCGADGVSTTLVKHCANGCKVNTGSDDACK